MGAYVAHASTTSGTIDTTYKYAWSNVGGWVNFGATNGGITITDTALTGYAWSANDGWINLAPTQSGVTNDGAGNLSGFAWDAGGGWVDFSGVTINSSGKFTGTATGGTVNGASYVINFDCTNCDVRTDWRPSSSRTTTTAVTPSGSISFIFPPSSPSSQTNSSQPETGQPPLSTSPAESTPGNPSRGTASAGTAGQGASPFLPLKSASTSTSSKTPTRANSTAGGAKFFNTKFVQDATVPVSIIVVALFLIFLIRFFL